MSTTSMIRTSRLLALILTLSAGFTGAIDAATIRVPQDQPTIQAGMDAAVDGDTVVVDDGTWTGDGNRDLDFAGKAITVRSLNGYESCTINCQGGSQNHRGFFFHSGEGLDSRVEGITIYNGSYYGGSLPEKFGGAVCAIDSGFIMTGCRIYWNDSRLGGGIYCSNCTIEIRDTIFDLNESEWSGGGLLLSGSDAVLENCVFQNNHSGTIYGGSGGGLCTAGGTTIISNSIFHGNTCSTDVGGIRVFLGEARFTGCIITGNAGNQMGGMTAVGNLNLTMTDCIVHGNEGRDFKVYEPAVVTITCSDIETVDGSVWPGEGNINEDPLFTSGPDGEFYLSQAAAGQAEDSPCVNAGDPQAAQFRGSTRTDQIPDRGVIDMGYHYTAVTQPLVTTGAGPDPGNPPLIRIFPPAEDAELEFTFLAYGVPAYGVKVAGGDPDGDGVDEILTGAGPGAVFGPHVRGFEVEGDPMPGLSFLAYGTNKYGVNVAAGDLDGDGRDEIITGAGPGAVFGPHVRGWGYDGEATVAPFLGVNYFAYGTPKWGVNVAAGDIDGDGFDEIVTGPGPGAVYGPHVRGWDVDGGDAAAIPALSYFAYGTLKFGVNVTTGDVDGDGIDEIVTGAGPGAVFGPHVRGWNFDGAAVTSLPGYSFFAWETAPLRFGVNVYAGTDLDGDGRDDLLVGRGPDAEANTEVKAFVYDGTAVSQWFMLKAFPGYRFGTTVAAGRF